MIFYDVVGTPLGPFAVLLKNGRISAARLGRKAERWIGARRRRLEGVRRWVRAFFAGRPVKPPLDWEGATPFERIVGEAVRRIPWGETRTYGQVARSVGRPGAARAVGRAMARNRFFLFVPCHRVVGAAGLGGFSAPGGAALKRRLLELEGGLREGVPCLR